MPTPDDGSIRNPLGCLNGQVTSGLSSVRRVLTSSAASWSGRVRLALAIAVLGAAFAVAFYVHQRHTFGPVFHSGGGSGSGVFGNPLLPERHHPSWEDPTAVAIAIGGIALAVGIVAYGPRSVGERFAKPS
jgi:hypothetical protein